MQGELFRGRWQSVPGDFHISRSTPVRRTRTRGLTVASNQTRRLRFSFSPVDFFAQSWSV